MVIPSPRGYRPGSPAPVAGNPGRRPHGHRHQAVVGHAWCGVDFRQPETPFGVLHHVRPPQPWMPRASQARGEFLQLAFLGLVETAGHLVAGIAGQVLGVVVVEGVRRAQADRRQHLPAQGRHGEFRAADPLLDQHLRVVAGASRHAAINSSSPPTLAMPMLEPS